MRKYTSIILTWVLRSVVWHTTEGFYAGYFPVWLGELKSSVTCHSSWLSDGILNIQLLYTMDGIMTVWSHAHIYDPPYLTAEACTLEVIRDAASLQLGQRALTGVSLWWQLVARQMWSTRRISLVPSWSARCHHFLSTLFHLHSRFFIFLFSFRCFDQWHCVAICFLVFSVKKFSYSHDRHILHEWTERLFCSQHLRPPLMANYSPTPKKKTWATISNSPCKSFTLKWSRDCENKRITPTKTSNAICMPWITAKFSEQKDIICLNFLVVPATKVYIFPICTIGASLCLYLDCISTLHWDLYAASPTFARWNVETSTPVRSGASVQPNKRKLGVAAYYE